MRMETGTFELRDNDMAMRTLTDAEINEVAGGTGTAAVQVNSQSAPGSAQTVNGTITLSTNNTNASAAISSTSASTGANNSIREIAQAFVLPPF